MKKSNYWKSFLFFLSTGILLSIVSGMKEPFLLAGGTWAIFALGAWVYETNTKLLEKRSIYGVVIPVLFVIFMVVLPYGLVLFDECSECMGLVLFWIIGGLIGIPWIISSAYKYNQQKPINQTRNSSGPKE